MADTKYPNSGVMFNNDRKETDKHPDRTGSADITCPKCNRESSYWLNGWIKDGAKGKFLSVAFKAKDAKPISGTQQKQEKPSQASGDFKTPPPDDDVPF